MPPWIEERLAKTARKALKHGLHSDQAKVRVGLQTARELGDPDLGRKYEMSVSDKATANLKLHAAKAHHWDPACHVSLSFIIINNSSFAKVFIILGDGMLSDN